MTDLVRYRGDRRESRAIGRELASLDVQTTMALARIERVADVQASRVHSVAYVGKQALHAAAMMTELEQQLSRLVPEAAGRLQALTDLTAIGLAEIVTETNHLLRR